MDEQMTFGEWLSRCRKALGLTQLDFAEKLDYALPTYRQAEQGNTASKPLIQRLARHFQLSDDEHRELLMFAQTGACKHAGGLLLRALSHEYHQPLEQPQDHPAAVRSPRTRLIGREAELADLIATLRQPNQRLVTLVGPPGVGKTLLARHALATLASSDAFPDGIFFISLANAAAAHTAISTVMSALGVKEAAEQPPVVALSASLGMRQALLGLDNMEQVLDVAPLLADLLEECPGLTLLTTSRAPLGLRLEQQILIAPLALPDLAMLPAPDVLAQVPAVALFLERAQLFKRGFQLTVENSASVVSLCVRLDGLPLALELVAKHVKLLSPQQLLEQLDRRLEILKNGPRDLPVRHQSLRAAVESSYVLLEPDAQALFRRLALFAGGCILEAVEQVCNAPGNLPLHILDGLYELIDQSLLQLAPTVTSSVRVAMLETLRAYAWEALQESGEAPQVQQAFCAYYLALAETAAEELRGPRQDVWLARLREERDNLRMALVLAREQAVQETLLRLAGALSRFWILGGAFSEGREWLELALERRQQVPTALVAKALHGLGWLMFLQSDHVAARQTLEESVALWRAEREPARLAQVLNNLGVVMFEQGEYERAIGTFHESIELRRALGDQAGLIDPLCNLGSIALLQKDIAQARSYYQESSNLSLEVGSLSQRAVTLNNLGWVTIVQGACAEACDFLEQSLALSHSGGLKATVAIVLNNLGVVALDRGELAQARELIRESMRMRQAAGDRLGLTENLQAFAGVVARHDPLCAASLFAAGVALRGQLGWPPAWDQGTVYSRYLQIARQAVGPAAWEAASQTGAVLSLDQALERALAYESQE